METRELAGHPVGVVGLGCNNLGTRCDDVQSATVVRAALDAGITLFDTADIYGQGRSEELLGKALGADRDRVVIATKFGGPMGDPERAGASARWVERACEDSLRRLGTDRIDLYQLHFPDQSVPIQETLEALHRLVTSGKVVAVGHSNFNGDQIDEAASVAADHALTPFRSAQNEYSLLRRNAEHDVVPAAQRHGLGLLPYFPLASGMLTGKYKRNEPAPEGTRLAGMPADRAEKMMSDKRFDVVERLTAFAEDRGHTLLELAFSWLLAQPTVASVIAGATKPEQIDGNVAAAGWRLTDDDLAEVDRLTAR
jgi:aryl-alcohol dehydrogenase-like predicted oxidoreductase